GSFVSVRLFPLLARPEWPHIQELGRYVAHLDISLHVGHVRRQVGFPEVIFSLARGHNVIGNTVNHCLTLDNPDKSPFLLGALVAKLPFIPGVPLGDGHLPERGQRGGGLCRRRRRGHWLGPSRWCCGVRRLQGAPSETHDES